MAHVQNVKEYDEDGSIVRTSQVVDDDGEARPAAHEPGQVVAARVVWYIAGLLIALLGIRFLLALLGANTTNAFANFIFSVSHPFVAPFFSLFSYNLRYGASHFEAYTLVAIAVYGLIAYAIAALATITRGRQAE